MKWEHPALLLLDQRLLPHTEEWVTCRGSEETAKAIEDMVVRGAPAIASAACFGLLAEVVSWQGIGTWAQHQQKFFQAVERLRRTRPTAVNLFHAMKEAADLSETFAPSMAMSQVAAALETFAFKIWQTDLETCKAIGRHGAGLLPHKKKLRVLTHCNAGSLATAGYGTALGIVRALHEAGRVELVYVDETRPYMQGTRLTAYEMMVEKIPYRLIADSAAAYVMQKGGVDLVVVGADRIAANGDTANKIGTYHLAVNAHFHHVPMVVAAPTSTIDPATVDGAGIVVEERSPEELTHFRGTLIAPAGTQVFNPSFDVTPNQLISFIVTEKGVFEAPYLFRNQG